MARLTVKRRYRPKVQLAMPRNFHGEVWQYKYHDGKTGTIIIYRQYGYASYIPDYETDQTIQTLTIEYVDKLIAEYTADKIMNKWNPLKELHPVETV